MQRYQKFIQMLNNIQKVCTLRNMTRVSLDLGRGAQCRARYAEAFTVEKSVLDSGSDYSVN